MIRGRAAVLSWLRVRRLEPAMGPQRLARCLSVLAASAVILSVSPSLTPAMAEVPPDPIVPAPTSVEYTPYSQTEVHADGSRTLRLYQNPAFTQDGGAGWRPVSNELIPNVAISTAPLVAPSLPLAFRPMTFGRSAQELVTLNMGGSQVALSSPDLSVSLPSVQDGRLTYANAATDTDLTLEAAGSGF